MSVRPCESFRLDSAEVSALPFPPQRCGSKFVHCWRECPTKGVGEEKGYPNTGADDDPSDGFGKRRGVSPPVGALTIVGDFDK